jgi:glutamyl-tRNA synthetase
MSASGFEADHVDRVLNVTDLEMTAFRCYHRAEMPLHGCTGDTVTVRTRIAPSPTGDPHVGTAYIALFNCAFARNNGGQFILRIEDTDQVRSTRESEQAILDALKWTGLEWDEGPDVGGPHGPYRQSERTELYREHAQILLDKGAAFRCFCSEERLKELRKEQRANKSDYLGYDGHCKSLSAEESQKRADAGEPFVVRMDVPREGECVFEDAFRGERSIEWSTVDYQVLMKSDGFPTYHLANVVDDHFMEITHVMRGEEWISSAPKHLKLYEAFGWEAPKLAHLPLLRNEDGSKLSKRKNPTSILFYERMGYLPEALLNHLGRMAYSMPNEEEKFTLEEMVESFSLDRVSLGEPKFLMDKLDWLNGRYIREDIDDAEFAERVKTWALNEDYLMQIVPLVKQRVDKLSDLGPLASFFFAGLHGLSPEDLDTKKLDADETVKVFQYTLWRLDSQREWTGEAIGELLKSTADILDMKFRDYIKPFFIAISGSSHSTPLFDSMAILGPDICRARIREAIEVLGGVSNKKAKKWERHLRDALREREDD